jgi:excisionase family DNA binding protein
MNYTYKFLNKVGEKKSKYLSVNQVADYLEVSKQAVNKWINSGNLKVYRLPSGRIKILRSDFFDYLKSHNLYIDRDFFNIEYLKVVVIDDDIIIHNFIRKFFEEINYKGELEFADDGFTGLLKIGIIQADIVLLDMEIPGMKELDVCKKILEESSLPKTKIIGLTNNMNKYNNNLKELGIIKIIEKPFTLRDLEEKLIPELYVN